ncbi:MAG: phospholipase [Candidatus Dormibacteraeota bacterium]|nr:phospholipase [Candidatus Dormibacteraeota bacterium]
MKVTRRDVLKGGAGVLGAGLAGGLSPRALRALAATASPGSINDIDHIVILIQENRSFDHYFGTYPDVRGFQDPNAITGVFSQQFAKNTTVPPIGRVLPYHLNTSSTGAGECTPDPGHSWGTQHQSWDAGAMDMWGPAHAGDADWSFMGYYTRSDLPYFYAVADAFTLCDDYHCSVLASTTSNRLYSVSAWLDPYGTNGGPVQSTISWTGPSSAKLTWTTYPERLTANGISWTAYSSPDADNEENPLVDFMQFYPGNAGFQPSYTDAVFGHTFEDFLVDAAAGNLPQVSWVLTSIVEDEHPSGAPQEGEFALQRVIDALTANPLTWPKTALFWTYDENGGFFDHRAPVTAPPGTYGEYVGSDVIGLGFRVPLLVISPFAKGGFVARDTFDHTSLLRFVETRFGVEIPNLTPWRRSAVGDLTSAFNFASPDTSVPSLPLATPMDLTQHPECATEEANMSPSPTPTSQSMPSQESGSRPSPSGPVAPTGVPETPYTLIEVAAGAAAIGGAWWLRRRADADE